MLFLDSGCSLDTMACSDGVGCTETASGTMDNVIACDTACAA